LDKRALEFNIASGVLTVHGYWDTTKDIVVKKLPGNLYWIEIPEIHPEIEG